MNPEAEKDINEIFNRNTDFSLNEIVGTVKPHPVTETLLKDLDLYSWAKSQTILKGGCLQMWNKMQRPLPGEIEIRIPAASPGVTAAALAELAPIEDSALWVFSNLPPLKEAWPMGMLFPTWPIVNRINNYAAFVEFFHLYRGHIAPWTHLVSPLVTLLGPYYYIRRSMKWNLSFKTYIQFIKKGLTQYLKPTPGMTPAELAYKYGFILVYIGVFFYSIIQSVEVARMLRDVRGRLMNLRRDIEKFIIVGRQLGVNLRLPAGLAGIHKLWTSASARGEFRKVLRAIYAADVIGAVHRLLAPGAPDYTIAVKTTGPTQIWSQGHPLLTAGAATQVRNPVSLRDNLIVTGPNAAGKTTYIKAIAANYILAQSLGICCASKALINPVELLGSFIRVSDDIGRASLFEAEVERCRKLYELAKAAKSAVFFIDEPMHSTPPIEGAAMATAFVKSLGSLPGVRVVATTHYHTMTRVLNGDGFANVSMDAAPGATGAFVFPYKLQKGPSFQCIAIELLKERELPDDIIESAIKIKKELYQREIV